VSKILSQEEIDALLTSAVDIERSSRVDNAKNARESVIVYNFRRPDRVSKEQIRSLHFLHDRFARNVGTSLSAYLRAVTEVSILSVEQFTYSEFLMSLPDPTAFYAVSMRPLEGLAAFELNPAVAFTMIDRMLGGSGRGVGVNRALTEIEQNVTDAVVKLLLENLTETWRGIVDVHFRISGRETRPQMLQVSAPNEVVLLLSFDIKIADTRGVLNFCIPAAAIESVGGSFARSWHRTKREPTPSERTALQNNLSRVSMPVTAAIETQLMAGELMKMRVGDVLALGHPIEQPIEIRVQGKTKFLGRPRVGRKSAAMAIEQVITAAGCEM
jgi:flagellar motor switch protein FliM